MLSVPESGYDVFHRIELFPADQFPSSTELPIYVPPAVTRFWQCPLWIIVPDPFSIEFANPLSVTLGVPVTERPYVPPYK